MKEKKEEKQPLSFEYEKGLFPDNENAAVCGTDEAGRGPLAGRVYAAAVYLEPENTDKELLSVLDDSKKLSEKKRAAAELLIREKAFSYAVAYSEVEEIEETDILSASQSAMRKAVAALSLDRNEPSEALTKLDVEYVGGKPVKAVGVTVDGNIARGFDIPAKTVVKGDGKSFCIAAASILAKTARDRYCVEVLEKEYPQYGFAKHKGYGTKEHYKAVDKYGLCEKHRKSFFKKYYDTEQSES